MSHEIQQIQILAGVIALVACALRYVVIPLVGKYLRYRSGKPM
ncbi:hypothetical protein [Pseudoxanthomonas winnipegensis]|nr:hypothetical protein [Pseudoxanthomonas winnipegensis]